MTTSEGQVADPIVRLEPSSLSVEPGGQTLSTLHVHNPSRVVEGYSFEVLGPAADFTSVVPPELSLLPDQDGVVQVIVQPPTSSDTPAGEVPIGVRCRSGVDGYHASVAEGSLSIGAVHAIESRLVADRRRGRWRGRYVVRVANTGNTTTTVDVLPREEDQLLGFAVAPTRLELARGEVGRSYVSVRPTAPFLVGSPERVPFTVEVERSSALDEPDPDARTELTGSFEQRAVGPRRVRGLIAVLALGLAGIAALAFLLPGDEGPAVATAPPVRSSIEDLQVVSHEEVRVLWSENRTASGYRVQRLTPGTVPEEGVVEEVENAPADVRALTFGGLAPATEHCFRIVAINEIAEAPPSDPRCATTPEEPAPTPSETDSPSPSDSTSEADGGGGGSDPASETPTSEPTTTSDATGTDTDQVLGPFVVFNEFQGGDIAQQGQAQQRVQDLQAQGVSAQLLFTNDLPPFEDGVWLVYESGFATLDAATARCDELTAALVVDRCTPFP